MAPFSQIRKYYFTACGIFFVLLLVLTLFRNDWTLNPQALISMIAGWLLLCAVIIGIVFLTMNRRRAKNTEIESEMKEEDKAAGGE